VQRPPNAPISGGDPARKFTPTERAILRALRRGLTLAQIAEGLKSSEVTVRTHLRNIRSKLEVRKTAELRAAACRRRAGPRPIRTVRRPLDTGLFYYDERDRERFADSDDPEDELPEISRPRRRYERRLAANHTPEHAERLERRRIARLWRSWIKRPDRGEDTEPYPPFPRFWPPLTK